MSQVDCSKYVKQRDGMDYLPWAACKQLLHENGAEVVTFDPVPGSDGTSLHSGSLSFDNGNDKTSRTTRIYEVVVHIKVDDLEWNETYPVVNGKNPVSDSSMNQLRVHNAVKRAFVKGVAERIGLGYNLWLKDEDLPVEEDLSKHSLFKCRQRLEELVTAKIKQGLPIAIIADRLRMTEEELRSVFAEYSRLARIEKAIWEMRPED